MRRRALCTVVALAFLAMLARPATPTVPARAATPAPRETVAELQTAVEAARQRFVARDAAGVLARVGENYRSGGVTKPVLRQQLLALYALYDAVRARVQVDEVQVVDGDAWVYTSGEVAGRLPFVGWVTVLAWQREPEVARRQAGGWRLVGFGD